MKEMLNQIAKYYPKSLRYERDFTEYIKSSPFKLLDKTVSTFHSSHSIWDDRIEKLNKSLDLKFHQQMPNHLDRCLSYQMKVPNSKDINTRINIDISAISPLYTIFIVKRWFDHGGFEKEGIKSDDPIKSNYHSYTLRNIS